MFTKDDYEWLHKTVFQPGYPGYKPEVREAASHDGKVDEAKRYAHVAEKYTREFIKTNPFETYVLEVYMARAYKLALEVAVALGVPEAFMPKLEYGALRVLEYPPGAVAHEHTDFNLFTLMMHRNQPGRFFSSRGTVRPEQHAAIKRGQAVNQQMHLGEIAEIIGIGPANKHAVRASKTTQHSIVYFAIPDHAAVLPWGQTVGAWLEERMKRTRIGGYT